MKKASLQIFEPNSEPRVFELEDKTEISIGRTPENDIALASDSNVSRRHAVLTKRTDEFYLVDNQSVNGTFVNNEKVLGERLLHDGDLLNIGGASVLGFRIEESEPEKISNLTSVVTDNLPPVSKKTFSTATAAVFGGLALASVVGAGAYLLKTEKCQPSAEIISPAPNAELNEPTEIRLRVQNKQCVSQIVFRVDGEVIQTVEAEPFTARIETNDYDDGKNHTLSVEVKSNEEDVFQTPEIAFFANEQSVPDVTETAANEPPENASAEQTPNKQTSDTTKVSIADVKKMSEAVLRQFPNGANYRLDAPLLTKIQAQTVEYKSDGYFKRAAVFRDVINIAFSGEQGLDAPLAYHLAMSRSKFIVPKSGSANGEGLWSIKSDFAISQGYTGLCGQETLSDANQNCAARATALYLKQLVFDRFGGDFIYAVACFGLTQSEAQSFAQTLSNERFNVWQNLKTAQQRENVSRFLAAAIVAENPSKFGLKRDQPISVLYRNLLNK